MGRIHLDEFFRSRLSVGIYEFDVDFEGTGNREWAVGVGSFGNK